MTISLSIYQMTISFSLYQMTGSCSTKWQSPFLSIKRLSPFLAINWWSPILAFLSNDGPFFSSFSFSPPYQMMCFPFSYIFFLLHHIQLPMLPTVTCFKKCLSHVHQTVSMHTVSSKCTKTISSSSLTWYLSAHSMYLVRSISPVLKAVTSCTAEASCLASVTRISFSTSVSHSLILGWAAIDTGVANITCQNKTFGKFHTQHKA